MRLILIHTLVNVLVCLLLWNNCLCQIRPTVGFDIPSAVCNDTVWLNVELNRFASEDTLFVQCKLVCDTNGDCEVSFPSEEFVLPKQRVIDNSVMDFDKRRGIFKIPILMVQDDRISDCTLFRCFARIYYDNDTLTSSISPPARLSEDCRSLLPSWCQWLFNIPTEYVDVITPVINLRGEQRQQMAGDLFCYDLSTASVQKILGSMEIEYSAPCWSFRGDRIAFVSGENERGRITILQYPEGKPEFLTDGSEDYSPLWLPGDEYIAFIRNKKLCILDLEARTKRHLDLELHAEELLSAFLSADSTTRLIISVKDEFTYGMKQTYCVIELDRNMDISGPPRLLKSDAIFMMTKMCDHKTKSMVYADDNLLVVHRVTGESEIISVGDSLDIVDPRYSSDGRKIIFVGFNPNTSNSR